MKLQLISALGLISTLMSACSPSEPNEWVGYYKESEEIMLYHPDTETYESSGETRDWYLDLQSDHTFRLLIDYHNNDCPTASGVWYSESTNLFYAVYSDVGLVGESYQIGLFTGIPSAEGIDKCHEEFGQTFRFKTPHRIDQFEFPKGKLFPESSLSFATLKKLVQSRPEISGIGAASKSEFLETVRQSIESQDLSALVKLAYFDNYSNPQHALDEFYFRIAGIVYEPTLEMREYDADQTAKALKYMKEHSENEFPVNAQELSYLVLNTRVFKFARINGRWLFVSPTTPDERK